MVRTVTLRLGGDFAGRWIRWDLAKLREIQARSSRSDEEVFAILAGAAIDTNLTEAAGAALDLRRVDTWEDLGGDVLREIYDSLRRMP